MEAAKARQTIFDWGKFREVEDGFFIPRKTPSTFVSGYHFFLRRLGKLVSEPGRSMNWQVLGHRADYDSSLWANLKAPASEPAASSDGIDGTNCKAPESEASGTAEYTWRGVCVCFCIMACRQVLVNRGSPYTIGASLGEGTFGKVFQAEREGDQAAVKMLKAHQPKSSFEELRQDALREAYVLDRCQGHPNTVQLLDAFLAKDAWHLVFELWGWTWRRLWRASPCSPRWCVESRCSCLKPYRICTHRCT